MLTCNLYYWSTLNVPSNAIVSEIKSEAGVVCSITGDFV